VPEPLQGWILLLVADGVPVTHVAAIVGINRCSVYKWVLRFLHEGRQGLADKPSLGRKGSTRPPDLDGEAHARRLLTMVLRACVGLVVYQVVT
jgi:transposase